MSTPDLVRSHWLGGADAYWATESRGEAEERAAAARSRASRAEDVELVGESLVVARLQQGARQRWAVFHAKTALPVLMPEPDQDAEQARVLARALDAWRDTESEQPFEWSSTGFFDRLRSPYGRGLPYQVRGREPEESWDEPAPADAISYDGDGERAGYVYTAGDRSVEVYAPDGLLIARGTDTFDVSTKKTAFVGEMRDGRHIAAKRSAHFVQHAVEQRRAS
ncbi:hypothetical protein [Streptomyces sp. NPDC058623]|uniref:hypothetical protein n=1 Tax=Streptomyces sp. NPDC058623 TaxID=3346563 RepID=UPI003666F020